MKQKLAIVLAAVVFGSLCAQEAQDTPDFVPEPNVEAVIEATEDEIYTLDLETLGNEEEIEAETGGSENQSGILFTIDADSRMIVCEFPVNGDVRKIIEIVSSDGSTHVEVSVSPSQKSVNIPINKLKKGIYILRILLPETQKSILSKAFVIG